jgi:hypothetical protein
MDSGTGSREAKDNDTNTERKKTIEPRVVAQEPERQETEIQRETNHRAKGRGTGTRETGDRKTERYEP